MEHITQYNQQAWDAYVDKQDQWTIPVSEATITDARAGTWSIVLTPTLPVPRHWFPELSGLRILGLASGGGQQGPVLAAAGASVTIFDQSEKQLLQDRKLSDRFNLGITTIQGDMTRPLPFEDGSFDLIINPCSILFIPDVKPLWKECFRLLRPGGVLMTGLIQPVSFQLEETDTGFQLVYPRPYSDLASLPAAKLDALRQDQEALIFGHSLSDQIGGQLEAGFMISDMFEDDWNGANGLDAYMPAFIATRAVKPL
jgi:SAM-dependent methyltransferase